MKSQVLFSFIVFQTSLTKFKGRPDTFAGMTKQENDIKWANQTFKETEIHKTVMTTCTC